MIITNTLFSQLYLLQIAQLWKVVDALGDGEEGRGWEKRRVRSSPAEHSPTEYKTAMHRNTILLMKVQE